MKKRLLSIIYLFSMMVILLPLKVKADSTNLGDGHKGHMTGNYIGVGSEEALNTAVKNAIGHSISLYLTADIKLTNTVYVYSHTTLNLCLNGYSLDANQGDYSVLRVSQDATVNLYDCSDNMQGKITGGKRIEDTVNTQPYGGGVYNQGTFNMYGGVITNNSSAMYGGGVFNLGTFHMYGGKILENTAKLSGGGVFNYRYEESPGNFNMYGGEISRNRSTTENGGGVYCESDFYMTGGKITNNVAQCAGGVYVSEYTKLGGTVIITDNIDKDGNSNLYLDSNKIECIQPLSVTGSAIGISMQREGVFTSSINNEDNSQYKEAFIVDNGSSKLVSDGLQLKLLSVFVAGVNVADTQTTYWKTDGDGGITSIGASKEDYNIKYEPEMGNNLARLTLRNANITKNYLKGYCQYGIRTDQSMELILVGNNSVITTAKSDLYSYAIKSNDTFIISGSGNLNVSTTGGLKNVGIFNGDSLFFEINENGKLVFNCTGEINVTTSGSKYTNGIVNDFLFYFKCGRVIVSSASDVVGSSTRTLGFGEINLEGGNLIVSCGAPADSGNSTSFLNPSMNFFGNKNYKDQGYQILIGSDEKSTKPIDEINSNDYEGKSICTSILYQSDDLQVVKAAKASAEITEYNSISQSVAADEGAVEMVLNDKIRAAINNSNVAFVVNRVQYIKPVAGSLGNPNGTNGSYTFNITVTKGLQSDTTIQKTIVITSTPYANGNSGGNSSGGNGGGYSGGNSSGGISGGFSGGVIGGNNPTEEHKGENQGHVIRSQQQENGSQSSHLNNTDEELMGTVFTAEERAKIATGEDARIILKVKDISSDISDSDKKLITENLDEQVLGLYIDLSLYKSVGDGKETNITTTSGKISVSIEVPEKLRPTDITTSRTYRIIRIHDGIVTIIDGTYDPVTHLFTFETDQFSTYALVYKDKAITLSDYHYLCLKAKAADTAQKLTYAKVVGADGYYIYGAECGANHKLKKLADVSRKTTAYDHIKLDKATFYKYQVKAYKLVDGKKVIFATSKLIYSTTARKTYANPIKVTTNTSNVRLIIGKSKIVSGEVVLPKDKKNKVYTTAIKFDSSNPEIAQVSSTGKITGISKGNCYIYVYAQNGVYSKVKVTVE